MSVIMRSLALFLGLAAVVLSAEEPARFAPPAPDRLYHGVYPGGVTGEEDDITPADLAAYEAAVGQSVAWVYFSHNWYRDRTFPLATAAWIRDQGAVPWIRLMLRSSPDQRHARREREFRLARILDGDLDDDLRAWARAARDFGTPLLAEYGTEMNGEWFPWNARWNGGRRTREFGDPDRPDGPERFAAAFRRIVTLAREEGAANVSWVFHVNGDDGPPKDWNRLEDYWPGEDVVDFVAVSAYGPQTPRDRWVDTFRDTMDSVIPRLTATAPGKPVLVAEFGVTAGNPRVAPEEWAGAALDDLFARRWPAVAGFSLWNERWENDRHPANDTTMRVQDTPALAAAIAARLAAHEAALQTSPVFSTP
jgi:hypothetical protein